MPPRLQIPLHLLTLALLAFALRAGFRDWDGYLHLHPDERHMVAVTAALEAPDGFREGLNTDTSPFNPYNRGIRSYVYGMLPLKLVHAATVARGESDWVEIERAGRWFSALWSTGTVVLIYLLSLRLASPRFASWVTLLMALTVMCIQQAHFYTVDSAGVFFTTLVVGLGVLAVKENRLWMLIASGALVGMAMACRLNLGLLAFWVGFAALSMAWRNKSRRPLAGLACGGLLALLLFRLLQPYAFESTGFFPTGLNPDWLRDVREVRAISHGELEVPYTLQWVDRTPYLFALKQIAAWGMGWPLGLMALAGSLRLLWTHRFQPWHWRALIVLWPLILIGYHGGIFLHTLRYFLPAYPMLILGGALALKSLESVDLRRILIGLVLAGTVLYAAAFMNLYRQPHPRIEASRWLYAQLPAGGVVAGEHWDDAMPLRLPGAEDLHRDIEILNLEVYHPESPEKIRTMLEQIDRADYLVLSSTRASHTIPRAPPRYPVMSRFYRRLARGETRSGLKEVARFHRRPRLLGWELDSLQAEEAFRVYDHPLVRVYEKTPIFSVEAAYGVLTDGIEFSSIPDIRYGHIGGWNNGWLTPAQWARRQTDVAWSQRFPDNGIGNQAPAPTWILMLLLFGAASFPLCFFLFPSLRDRGWETGRLLVLLLIGGLAWFPAAMEWMPFDRTLSFAAIAVFAASALLFGLHHEPMLAWLSRHWKRLLFAEAVFWGVFAFFLWLRFMQPDLWHPWAGGEKPMDLAFLNAVSQTPYFPAPNPWLSGAFINYYDYGFVLVACLIRLTGISPDIAYNLSLPTFAAFTAGGALALSSAFLPLFRTRRGWKGWKRTGILAVALTLFIGNLGQVRWLLEGRPGHPRDGYWDASRVIRVPEDPAGVITEFPFFSLLYGDLHAHLMALPIAMLCLLCAWQLFRRFHPLRLLAAAGVLGALWITNAWDFPAQAAILLFALFAGVFRAPSTDRVRFLWSRLGWALTALAAARLLYAPFHDAYLAPETTFGLWTGPRSPLFDLFLAHGIFLVPLFGGLFLLTRERPSRLRAAPWTARLWPMLLFAGCLVLIPLVELVHLKGDVGRMNTVFKFYYQIWWMLALLTALVFTAVGRISGRHIPRTVYTVLATLLFLGGTLYPLTAIPVKWKDRYWPTEIRGLDGLAYMKKAGLPTETGTLDLSEDLEAIRWLRKHAKPFDVILEAQRPEYQWGSRLATHTGLPTVLGWNWHMRQQRPPPGTGRAVWRRADDIRRFYSTENPEEALDILRSYDVRFVAWGGVEQQTYTDFPTREALIQNGRLVPVEPSDAHILYRFHSNPDIERIR